MELKTSTIARKAVIKIASVDLPREGNETGGGGGK